jgi:hypothetical protein
VATKLAYQITGLSAHVRRLVLITLRTLWKLDHSLIQLKKGICSKLIPELMGPGLRFDNSPKAIPATSPSLARHCRAACSQNPKSQMSSVYVDNAALCYDLRSTTAAEPLLGPHRRVCMYYQSPGRRGRPAHPPSPEASRPCSSSLPHILQVRPSEVRETPGTPPQESHSSQKQTSPGVGRPTTRLSTC